MRGNTYSGFIQRGAQSFRLGIGQDGRSRLFEQVLEALPPDDAADLPDGGGTMSIDGPAEVLAENTVQDLLVVYTSGACSASGSCAQLELDIVSAVADINTVYAASGINITMNLVGTMFTSYPDGDASPTLSALASTTDGNMDDVHTVRDDLGADIVAMVFNGSGCGIGYLGSSASSAFSVTHYSCLLGNRTMNHEIGHNQGAHHDRVTAGAGSSSNYNYGYRRCNDASVADNNSSPWFRTVMGYGCSSASRVGRMSNPNINYNGVPQGIDPAVEPNNGSWNAKTINNSAVYMAGFRNAPPTTVPSRPTGLSATAGGPDSIDLVWTDTSTNETSFEVDRSPDGSSWALIATLDSNTTTHTDNGLLPETRYHYRVRARNSAGYSLYSDPDFDDTDPLPVFVEDLAYADVSIKGQVSGTYAATNASGGSYQSITETHSGGPKRSRKQSYRHGWSFDVFGGAGGVVVTANAWVSGSEGANFYYSLDAGATRTLMFTVNNTAPAADVTFALPGGVSGLVRIEVEDATQSNGEAVDTVNVDYLLIASHTEAGDPPLAPSGMSVAGTSSSSVDLLFTDHAEDEFGFEIWRAGSDPGIDCDAGSSIDTIGVNAGTGTVAYTDNTVSPSSTYWFWAKAFNGAGDDGSCSNAVQATTGVAPAIDLYLVDPYKVKGRQKVDLEWSGTTTANVDIVRDGNVVATVADTGAYTDPINAKGGGSYLYKICEQGSSTACSQEVAANF
jgi:hypothetical protein